MLVFSGDLPLRDEPLPRFLDDAAFTKLLRAARGGDDPFVRLCVEFLARIVRKIGGAGQRLACYALWALAVAQNAGRHA